MLAQVTRFSAVSLQPNSGSAQVKRRPAHHRAYHLARATCSTNIALIPSSAHGTNPASAVMAGMRVVVVKCDELGNVDVGTSAPRPPACGQPGCLMVTYPEHPRGVRGESARSPGIVRHGGLVAMDGART